jgi:TonB family protein
MKLFHVLSMALLLAASLAFGQSHTVDSSLLALADPQVAQQDTARPPADFIEVDKEPTVLSKKEPVYPEAAKKAGTEGKVWAKIWVDKKGMPRNVTILKSDAEVFNKAVLDAAYGFRFTPALIKDKPVDVWVSVPFMFKLAEKVSGAERKGYEELAGLVRDVLNGKKIDSTMVRKAVHPEAYAVIGGEYIHLLDALRRQASGDRIIEPANRKMEFTSYVLDGKGGASLMTVRTKGAGKNPKPRFHTIVFFAGDKGEWTIRSWHASQ